MQQISFLDSITKWPPGRILRINHNISLSEGLGILVIPSIGSTPQILTDLVKGAPIGIVGGAMNIDNEIGPVFSTTGSGQYFYVVRNYSTIPSPIFSANIWFRGIQQTATYGIWSWASEPTSGFPFALIQVNGATLRFLADTAYRETSQTLTNNVLYNIGISRNSGNVWSFYLNGKLLSTYTDDGTPGYIEFAQNIYIGTGYNTSYYGHFGQFAFWDRELAAAEFQALYNPQTRWSLVQPVEPPRFLSISAVIIGSTCWGHSTGVTETNIRTFAANWTGTGAISGSGDAETICLNASEYMESEVVNTGTLTVELAQNVYIAGDDILLRYRHGASEAACLAAAWNNYTIPFDSSGYVQVRIESTL